MVNVGDKVRGIKSGVVFTVTDTDWYHNNNGIYQIVKVSGWPNWYDFNDRFEKVPQTRKYRVYKEIEASSAAEARRLLGESFSVEEVK